MVLEGPSSKAPPHAGSEGTAQAGLLQPWLFIMYSVTVLMTFDSLSLSALLPVLLVNWIADFSLHLLSVIASAANSDKTQVFSNYKVFYHDILKDSFFWSLNLSDMQFILLL